MKKMCQDLMKRVLELVANPEARVIEKTEAQVLVFSTDEADVLFSWPTSHNSRVVSSRNWSWSEDHNRYQSVIDGTEWCLDVEMDGVLGVVFYAPNQPVPKIRLRLDSIS